MKKVPPPTCRLCIHFQPASGIWPSRCKYKNRSTKAATVATGCWYYTPAKGPK